MGNTVIKRLKPDFVVLDGLRGIAAVYVVINHCRGHLVIGGSEYEKIVSRSEWSIATKIYYSLLQLTSLGREFVIFFFVLSGFSIAHSLTSKNNKSFFSFYQRRLIRLYPPYLLALVWAAVVFGLVQQFAPHELSSASKSVFHDTNSILSNLIYIPKGSLIAQFWSLTHEVIFYIIIPVFFLAGIRYYIWLSIVGYITGVILNPFSISEQSILAIYFFEYNIFFAIGMLLYMNYERAAKWLMFKKTWFFIISAILFIATVLAKFKLGELNKVTMLLAAVLSVLMIVNFLRYGITNGVLDFFGKMSYSIYIFHVASIYLFILILNALGITSDHNQIDVWYIWMIGVLFCLAVTIPLYYIAEYPTKKILSRMRG